MGLLDLFRNKNVNVEEKKFSSVSITNLEYGSTRWTPLDYENFVKEGYLKNIIANKCINLIAQSVSQIEWKIVTKLQDGTIENYEGDLNKILIKPNNDESFAFFMYKNIIFYISNGNNFIERVYINKEQYPRELYCLRSDKFKIELDEKTGIIKNYIYDNKINFPVDIITGKSNILQIKTVNPLDDFWGQSLLYPAMREIDSSNEAIEWQKKIFENEGRPGMVLMTEKPLTKEQFTRLEEMIKQKHSGSYNAGKEMILEGGMKAQVYNWSPKELDFINSNNELARRIAFSLGVPPVLVGIQGDSTFRNYETARLAFWEDTVLFYANLYKSELNNWFFNDNPENLFFDYEIDKIPALREKRIQSWAEINNNAFLTINEKRNLAGFDDIEGGDVLLIPMNMIPIEENQTIETTEEQEENDNTAKNKLNNMKITNSTDYLQ